MNPFPVLTVPHKHIGREAFDRVRTLHVAETVDDATLENIINEVLVVTRDQFPAMNRVGELS